jgi:hypothetical protein
VRHKTGLSVGTAKTLVKRDSDDYPWRQGDVYDLTGAQSQILLAPEGATEIPTGQFRVAPIEGDVTTLGVDVDLDERQIQGRDKTANVLGDQWTSRLSFEDGIADPSWLVSELAMQMGYGVTAPPNQDGYVPVLDVPLQGSLSPAYPKGIDFRMQSGSPVWGELDGLVSLYSPNDGSTVQFVRYAISQPLSTLHTLTFDVSDRAEFQWIRADQTVNGSVTLSVTNRTLANPDQFQVTMSSRGLNGVFNTNTGPVTYTYPVPEDRPSGIQVQVEFTPSAGGANWNSARFRARRGAGSAWSAWSAVHTFTNALSPADTVYNFWLRPLHTSGQEAHLARVSLVDSAASLNQWAADQLWAAESLNQQGRLYLEPLFGTIRSPWLDPGLTVLNAMQAVVEAWQGALITDVYGDLRLMNRFTLSGVATGNEPVMDIGVNFEDLPWVMDYSDQADRLTLTYRPVIIREADNGPPPGVPIVWELAEVRAFWPGVSELFFSLDYIYPVDLKLIPFVRKDNDDGVRHVWDAYRYNNGTGAHINPGDDIQLRIDRVTSSTWKVHVVNLTASPFHMVDNTGTPYLKIRSTYYLDQTQEAVIERGVPSNEATNPLEINLANYVQNEADANALADFIWARVNRRTWRAKTVKTVPDYSIDLGDVREIVHSRTQVRSNVLISKVKLSGEPGSVRQELDLILIPPTWEDFDEVWGPEYHTSPPGSWTEFDALWAPYTWDDFDRTPTATTNAQIQEGM